MNNKLDLIFEKEPPEVQQKLIGLLIQYNAMMQYNQKEDKFEVDLLLPFKTTKEKEQFVKNYKKRNRSTGKKEAPKSRQTKNENEMAGKPHFLSPTNKQNEKNEQGRHQQKYQTLHNEKRGVLQNHIENFYNDREDSAEISYQLTNENESIRRKTITFMDISSAIKHKIRRAVEEIKTELAQHKGNLKIHQTNRDAQFRERDLLKSQDREYIEEKYLPKQQESEIESIPLNFMKREKEEADQKQYGDAILGDKIGRQLNPSEQKQVNYYHRDGFKDTSLFNSRNSGQSSQIRQQILIEQERNFSGEQLYHPANSYLKDTYKKSQASSFPQIIEEENEEDHRFPQKISIKQTKNYLDSERQSYFKERPRSRQKEVRASLEKSGRQKTPKQPTSNLNNPGASFKKGQGQSSIKQKLNEKYSSRKVNSSNLRQKYTQFLKKNHRDFDRIYETIRKQIKRNESRLSKRQSDDPILVLEQGLSDAYSEEDRIFKEEIIKDYQKHIIAHNENMSSEDLVKYFRYLLQNAKNLYIKHLRKGK